MTLTPLEHAILGKYHEAFAAMGFPAPDVIEVRSRENTAAGRFTYLAGPTTQMSERVCDPPESWTVVMEGLEHGLGFLLFMEDGRPDMLELHSHATGWDGEERPWRLVAARGEGKS